jgi:cytochrome c1
MKTLLPLLFLGSSLFAVDGYEVYKNNCAACHIEMITKAETLKSLDKLKAPPMIEVSRQLRDTIIIKGDDEEVHRFVTISFIKEYIKNPSLDYFMCNAGAVDHFGVMPAQSHLSDAERQAVGEWIYDRYEGIEFK